MIQTHEVIAQLRQQWPELAITIEPTRTRGDHVTDVPLAQIGGDGVFVTEIERALRERRIDLAVHSLKDVPTAQPDDVRLIVTGPRADVRDALVFQRARRLQEAEGDREQRPEEVFPLRIGTCSLRRTAQILALRPDAQLVPLRGNVDTRLRQLDAGDYDAIVLAAAGLHRLGLQEQLADRMTYLPVEVMMPAPGQGALGLEVRDEPELLELIAPLRDLAASAATSAERLFMRRLGAGCYLPVAAYGEIVGEKFTLQGLVISRDGRRQVRLRQSIRWTPEAGIELAERLGIQLAELALVRGAAEIIATLETERLEEQQHV
jgi:hydroxymethylbilane synthase